MGYNITYILYIIPISVIISVLSYLVSIGLKRDLERKGSKALLLLTYLFFTLMFWHFTKPSIGDMMTLREWYLPIIVVLCYGLNFLTIYNLSFLVSSKFLGRTLNFFGITALISQAWNYKHWKYFFGGESFSLNCERAVWGIFGGENITASYESFLFNFIILNLLVFGVYKYLKIHEARFIYLFLLSIDIIMIVKFLF